MLIRVLRALPSSSSDDDFDGAVRATAKRLRAIAPVATIGASRYAQLPRPLSTTRAHTADADADADDGSGAPASATRPKPQTTALVTRPAGKQRKINITYYVCTACGWSGATPSRHPRTRTTCDKIPCQMWIPNDGRPHAEAVRQYLSRCSPAQREYGLAPEGERPLVHDGKAYLCVPDGKRGGDSMELKLTYFKRYVIVIPNGHEAGDRFTVDVEQLKALPSAVVLKPLLLTPSESLTV